MNEGMIYNLDEDAFACLFGTRQDKIARLCGALIKRYDFRYRVLPFREKEKIIAAIIDKLQSNQFTVAGKEGKARWEHGWKENLDAFIKSGYSLDSLVPQYIRRDQPVRLCGEYVAPEDKDFELHWREVFTAWLYRTYFQTADAVYEFGCGTGRDLLLLNEFFPQKKLYGFDWAVSSSKIINGIAEKRGLPLKGYIFDMFSPDESVMFSANSAVFTFSALEQIGADFDPFLQFILHKKPAFVVHVETFFELFSPENPFDEAAIRFGAARNYLKNYLTRLRDLERAGKLEIIALHRVPFGNLYIEGYSYCVWKPL